jgi:hypothetical protein
VRGVPVMFPVCKNSVQHLISHPCGYPGHGIVLVEPDDVFETGKIGTTVRTMVQVLFVRPEARAGELCVKLVQYMTPHLAT